MGSWGNYLGLAKEIPLDSYVLPQQLEDAKNKRKMEQARLIQERQKQLAEMVQIKPESVHLSDQQEYTQMMNQKANDLFTRAASGELTSLGAAQAKVDIDMNNNLYQSRKRELERIQNMQGVSSVPLQQVKTWLTSGVPLAEQRKMWNAQYGKYFGDIYNTSSGVPDVERITITNYDPARTIQEANKDKGSYMGLVNAGGTQFDIYGLVRDRKTLEGLKTKYPEWSDMYKNTATYEDYVDNYLQNEQGKKEVYGNYYKEVQDEMNSIFNDRIKESLISKGLQLTEDNIRAEGESLRQVYEQQGLVNDIENTALKNVMMSKYKPINRSERRPQRNITNVNVDMGFGGGKEETSYLKAIYGSFINNKTNNTAINSFIKSKQTGNDDNTSFEQSVTDYYSGMGLKAQPGQKLYLSDGSLYYNLPTSSDPTMKMSGKTVMLRGKASGIKPNEQMTLSQAASLYFTKGDVKAKINKAMNMLNSFTGQVTYAGITPITKRGLVLKKDDVIAYPNIYNTTTPYIQVISEFPNAANAKQLKENGIMVGLGADEKEMQDFMLFLYKNFNMFEREPLSSSNLSRYENLYNTNFDQQWRTRVPFKFGEQ